MQFFVHYGHIYVIVNSLLSKLSCTFIYLIINHGLQYFVFGNENKCNEMKKMAFLY